MEYSKCPNCDKSVGGMFGAVIVRQSRTDLINHALKLDKPAYCVSCSEKLGKDIVVIQNEKFKRLNESIKELEHIIPVITSQAPSHWEYEVLDMVTIQTTTGTGFITELSQVFNDFLGRGSKTTNLKIEVATSQCKADLRSQCLSKGGNAVIATDIDFNEIGTGSTNMLMVCMAGTAIKVSNPAQINRTHADKFELLTKLSHEFEAVRAYNIILNEEYGLGY